MKTIIPTYGVDPLDPQGMPQGEFIITPDSRWYIGSGFGITAIDLLKLQLERIVDSLLVYPITCRKMIK